MTHSLEKLQSRDSKVLSKDSSILGAQPGLKTQVCLFIFFFFLSTDLLTQKDIETWVN